PEFSRQARKRPRPDPSGNAVSSVGRGAPPTPGGRGPPARVEGEPRTEHLEAEAGASGEKEGGALAEDERPTPALMIKIKDTYSMAGSMAGVPESLRKMHDNRHSAGVTFGIGRLENEAWEISREMDDMLA